MRVRTGFSPARKRRGLREAYEDFIIEKGVLVEYRGNDRNVIIPDGVSEIGDYVFREKDIESVKIPSTVETIGYCAFYDCKKIRSVTIPEGVTFIDGWAFGDCTNLESVTIPASVEYIGEYAFGFCDKLASVRFGDLGMAIKEYAFAHCENIKDFPFESFTREEMLDIFADDIYAERGIKESLEDDGDEYLRAWEDKVEQMVESKFPSEQVHVDISPFGSRVENTTNRDAVYWAFYTDRKTPTELKQELSLKSHNNMLTDSSLDKVITAVEIIRYLRDIDWENIIFNAPV